MRLIKVLFLTTIIVLALFTSPTHSFALRLCIDQAYGDWDFSSMVQDSSHVYDTDQIGIDCVKGSQIWAIPNRNLTPFPNGTVNLHLRVSSDKKDIFYKEFYNTGFVIQPDDSILVTILDVKQKPVNVQKNQMLKAGPVEYLFAIFKAPCDVTAHQCGSTCVEQVLANKENLIQAFIVKDLHGQLSAEQIKYNDQLKAAQPLNLKNFLLRLASLVGVTDAEEIFSSWLESQYD
jgi:hypothetical protein